MRMRLESSGVQSAILDLCANRPQSGDVLTWMPHNLENLLRAFANTPEP